MHTQNTFPASYISCKLPNVALYGRKSDDNQLQYILLQMLMNVPAILVYTQKTALMELTNMNVCVRQDGQEHYVIQVKSKHDLYNLIIAVFSIFAFSNK